MQAWKLVTHFFVRYFRIVLLFLSIIIVSLQNGNIPSTLAYFSAHDKAKHLHIRTGEWIPEVIVDIDNHKDGQENNHDEHGDDQESKDDSHDGQDSDKQDGQDRELEKKDGNNSFCIRLFSSLPDTDIYYEFSDDGDPIDGGNKYNDNTQCLIIPKGSRFLQTQAVRKQNDNWKSDVESIDLSSTDKNRDRKHGGDNRGSSR